MDNPSSERVILYTRYPVPGKAKTRLIPELGESGAARLQSRLTERVCDRLRPLLDPNEPDPVISFEGGSREKMRDWLGAEWTFVEQGGGTLGDRMLRTVRRAFEDGHDRAVIIGSDCPDLTLTHVRRALESLKDHDLVLGPARDGGYYLIGLSTASEELFRGISWGTDTVLDETIERANALGLSHTLLEPLRDVDRPDDLDAVPDDS